MPNDQRAWHALSADEALSALGTGPQGLSDAEAASRLDEHGPNELPTEAPSSRLWLFLKQFHSALMAWGFCVRVRRRWYLASAP